jgi:hypothetical protein
MPASAFDNCVGVLAKSETTRRTLSRGMAGLSAMIGLELLGLERAEARKRGKRKRGKRKNQVRRQAANPETTIFIHHLDVVIANPCTGEDIHVVGDAKIVNHAVRDASGGGHFRVMSNLKGVSATGLTSGISYRVVESSSTVFLEGPLPMVTTLVGTLSFISQGGTDNFVGHSMTHVTINANGELTAFVEIKSKECRG